MAEIQTMYRGDTFTFLFTVLDPDTGTSYSLKDSDRIYLALMEPHSDFEHSLLYKVTPKSGQSGSGITPSATAGLFAVTFNPEDTELLVPGVYYYTIKLHRQVVNPVTEVTTEENYTVLPKTKFIILD